MRNLNCDQIAAATTEAKKVVVIAGPGSGKTETLAARAENLIARGADPGKMVLISYTNAAAEEIQRRVGRPFGYVGTLHGFLLRLIRQHGRATRLLPSEDVAVITEEMRDDMVEEIKAELKVNPRKDDMAFALTHNACLRPHETPFALTDAEVVAAEYYRRLAEAGLVDFDAILDYGEAVLDKLKNKGQAPAFDALMVDEFQDISKADARIFGKLNADNKFFVGDPMQAIFGFRGGDPTNLADMTFDPEFESIALSANYRCGVIICAAANGLASPGYTRSARDIYGSVRVFGYDNELAELAGVTAWAKDMAGGSTAVLVRTNSEARLVLRSLEDAGVAAFGRRHCPAPEDWADVRAFVHYLASPKNETLCFAQLVRLFGKPTAEDAKVKGLTARKPLWCFVPLGCPLRVAGVPDAVAREGFSTAAVEVVRKVVGNLDENDGFPDLVLALNDPALFESKTGSEGVEVLTIHAAKGREWDAVALPFWNEGAFPLPKEDRQEANRLAFVAITRARSSVAISFAARRRPAPWSNKTEAATANQFIGTIIEAINPFKP